MNPNQYPTLTNWSDYPKINIHEFLARFDDLQMPMKYGEVIEHEEFIDYYDHFELVLIEGDIHITETQLDELKESYRTAIVVNGNLSVEGAVKKVFYVHGDIYCDRINLNHDSFRSNFATFNPERNIHARHYVVLSAEDHEIMRDAPKVKVQTPYLFAWFYELDNLDISPETIIFILGDWDYCQNLGLPNPILSWHDCVFVSPYSTFLAAPDSDEFPWLIDSMAKALKKNESIFIDNFNIQSLEYQKAGDAAFAAKDHKKAYLAYKHAAQLSPKYYPAWFGMGEALFEVGAFTQALQHYQIAADYFPHRQTNLINNALNYAALSAIRCQQFALAIELATRSIQHNSTLAERSYDQNYLAHAYRFRAEAYYLQGDIPTAIVNLKTALELNQYHNTANWLMGLMHYLEGNIETAQKFYQKAVGRDKTFKVPYDQAKDTSFLAKSACTVDWESEFSQTFQMPKKDEAYWLEYIAHHTPQSINKVPSALRTTAICLAALKKANASDQWLQFAKFFPQESINQEIAEILITHDACNIQYIPKHLVTKELCLLAPKNGQGFKSEYMPETLWDKTFALHAVACGTRLAQIPVNIIDEEICLAAIKQHTYDIEDVPAALLNDACYMIAIAHCNEYFFSNHLPSRYKHPSILKQTLSQYKCALDTIPGYAFTADVYAYAKTLYGNDDDWQAIEARHSPQYVAKNKDADVSEICWSALWDETFMVKHIAKKDYYLEPWLIPQDLFTPLVAQACFKHHPLHLDKIPSQFITQEMCEQFSKHYGDELAKIPVKYRNKVICLRAVKEKADLIKLVPLDFRTTQLCVIAMLENSDLDDQIPQAVYLEVCETLIKKHADQFYMGWLLLCKGNAYLAQDQPNIGEALKNYHAVLTGNDPEEYRENDIQWAYYMIGYCHYLQGNINEAQTWLQKLSDPDDYDQYAEFAFLHPTEPQDFNQHQFDSLMHDVDFFTKTHAYQEAYTSIHQAKTMLETSNNDDRCLWAYVLDNLRFISYELELWQENTQACEAIIERLGDENLWHYVSSDNVCRHALRSAYYRLATQGLDRIKTPEELHSLESLESLKHRLEMVEKVFTLKSASENENVLYPFYEGQAWILLFIAYQFDESYHSKAYSSLQKILKLGLVEKGLVTIEDVLNALKN